MPLTTPRSPTPPPKRVKQPAPQPSAHPPFPPPPPGYVHHVIVSHVGPAFLRDPEVLGAALRGLHYYKQGERHVVEEACGPTHASTNR